MFPNFLIALQREDKGEVVKEDGLLLVLVGVNVLIDADLLVLQRGKSILDGVVLTNRGGGVRVATIQTRVVNAPCVIIIIIDSVLCEFILNHFSD